MATSLNIASLTLFAGTNWSWVEDLPDYPASDYSLKIYLKSGLNPTVELNGVAEGNQFRFSSEPSQTSQLIDENYQYQAIASNGSDTFMVDSGAIRIQPLLSCPGYDPRSYWSKLLEKLRAAYLLAAERGYAEIETDEGTVRYTRETLQKELQYAEHKVREENKSARSKRINYIKVRFK